MLELVRVRLFVSRLLFCHHVECQYVFGLQILENAFIACVPTTYLKCQRKITRISITVEKQIPFKVNMIGCFFTLLTPCIFVILN
jgi:hypothetical protein